MPAGPFCATTSEASGRRYDGEFLFPERTRIIFGKETESGGAEAARVGKKVLLHYGKGSVIRSGLLDRVKASLKASGVAMVEIGGVQPNPRLSMVREGITLCRKEGVELILAVGGGSAIDSAKAIAAGVPYSGDVWDFFSGKASPKAALPVGCVLTIPAAGSESSGSTVITNEDGWPNGPHRDDYTAAFDPQPQIR